MSESLDLKIAQMEITQAEMSEKLDDLVTICTSLQEDSKDTRSKVADLYRVMYEGNGTPGAVTRLALLEEKADDWEDDAKARRRFSAAMIVAVATGTLGGIGGIIVAVVKFAS